jgi:hypothetical protein
MAKNSNNKRMESEEKIIRHEYDVFISYNHKDREHVIEIGELLKNNGISPWLDEWNLQPGLPWQPELDQKIEIVKSAAIFVGQAGMGFYHQREMYAFEREFSKRGLPVIPVLLPDVARETKIPVFLEGMTWVDFRKNEPDTLERLIWGITGQKPLKIYRSK